MLQKCLQTKNKPEDSKYWPNKHFGIIGDEVTVEFLLPDGPVFGPAYDPDDFYTDFWGLGTFRFTSCTEAEFTYNSVLGMGAGSYTLSKLYDVEQSSCP